MTSSIPFLNGSLLHISIGEKPPGISVCHSVSCAQKRKGSAIVESNTVWQLLPHVKLQTILNYSVGKFTSSKQVFAEGVIFFPICGDKSSPKLPKYFFWTFHSRNRKSLLVVAQHVKDMWLRWTADKCFCFCWLNIAFTDTWPPRTTWPDTILQLPCSYITSEGVLLELVLDRVATWGIALCAGH